MSDVKKYWLSWYATEAAGEWELHSPWWISGTRCSDDAATVCAAVEAESEEAAWAKIAAAYDDKSAIIEQRFIEPQSDDWAPFSGRFPRAKWMQWP